MAPKIFGDALMAGAPKVTFFLGEAPRPWPQEIFGDVFWTVAPKVTFEDGFFFF